MGATVADAAEESRVNADLATLLCARLQASKRATERLLGVLQVCLRPCCSAGSCCHQPVATAESCALACPAYILHKLAPMV